MELSIAAILSHSVHEGKPSPGEPGSKEEAPSGSAAPESAEPTEPTEPAAGATENIMVTHVRAGPGLGSGGSLGWAVPERAQGSVWIDYHLLAFSVGFVTIYCQF